jgi:hypothetical protein
MERWERVGKRMEKRADMMDVLEDGMDACRVRVCSVGAARMRMCMMAVLALLSGVRSAGEW